VLAPPANPPGALSTLTAGLEIGASARYRRVAKDSLSPAATIAAERPRPMKREAAPSRTEVRENSIFSNTYRNQLVALRRRFSALMTTVPPSAATPASIKYALIGYVFTCNQ
jgi:hypothetical protein